MLARPISENYEKYQANSRLQLFLVAQTVGLSVAVHRGLGLHSWDIKDWPSYLYVLNICGVLSIIAAALSKTSFAILLLHFSQGWMRRFVWFIIITVNLFLGLSCIFIYAQCTPVAKLWDSRTPGTCWDNHVVEYYNTFSSGTPTSALSSRQHTNGC